MTSTTMELVPLLSLCVLTWSGSTSADVQGPEIKVKEGSDVTLPCNITEDIESKRFHWKKDGQKEVYVYDSGLSSSQDLSGQSDQFKGRVSHFPGELKNGDASIKIRNTKVADSGNYTCEFRDLPNQKFLVRLLVGAASKPSVTILDEGNDWALLQCEVHGASPKPDVQWQDSDGKTLPAEEPQVSERGGSYDIILQTTVTKTDTYRCVATQEEIRHQVHAETYVRINGFSTGHVVGVAVGSVLGTLLVVLLLAVLRAKGFIKCSKGQSKTTVPDEDPNQLVIKLT
ncbi:butyrophilin-like protein 1 isoform X2 [Seriola aureovittata]|uniref:butyrophilin-like protein 1 isoform X2 n=1 Tax=Seriola aureovittata TaxID=2871759 RepID=UPI0024BDEAC5|nr:butyrophilin-like protein 1 isoform X2 [Seriola aureovittata]